MVASSFTRTWSDGPAVSLNGSPTVSPTTAAAWAGVFLPMTDPSGARTSVIVAMSLMRTCSDGPAVSLNGSPTVSPTTAAAWASVFLPRTLPLSSFRLPDSIYFFALSHAPPPLFKTVASRTPEMVPTMSIPATAS